MVGDRLVPQIVCTKKIELKDDELFVYLNSNCETSDVYDDSLFI